MHAEHKNIPSSLGEDLGEDLAAVAAADAVLLRRQELVERRLARRDRAVEHARQGK